MVWLQGGSRRAGKGSENGVDRKRMQKQKKYKKNKQKKTAPENTSGAVKIYYNLKVLWLNLSSSSRM